MARASLPDSPVGRNVSAWLDAFNSGDSLRLAAYYRRYGLRRYGLARSLEAQIERRAATGGFDVVSIEKSLPRYLEAVVRERATRTLAYLVSELAAGNDFEVTQSSIVPMPPGISPSSFRIDRATRMRVIESAIGKIDTNCVFPEVATRMASSVRARLRGGEYDNVTNGVTFANLLTRDLRAVSHDLHLAVNFSPRADPRSQSPPGFSAARAASPRHGTPALRFREDGASAREHRLPEVQLLRRSGRLRPYGVGRDELTRRHRRRHH